MLLTIIKKLNFYDFLKKLVISSLSIVFYTSFFKISVFSLNNDTNTSSLKKEVPYSHIVQNINNILKNIFKYTYKYPIILYFNSDESKKFQWLRFKNFLKYTNKKSPQKILIHDIKNLIIEKWTAYPLKNKDKFIIIPSLWIIENWKQEKISIPHPLPELNYLEVLSIEKKAIPQYAYSIYYDYWISEHKKWKFSNMNHEKLIQKGHLKSFFKIEFIKTN